MKKLLVVLSFLLVAVTCHADQKAVTDTGDEVILYSDGTWAYIDDGKSVSGIIETNPAKFTKPASATFKLKSTKNNSIYWIDTSKWLFTKEVDNEAAEYEFRMKEKDVYGMAINEEAALPLESLAEIAFSNALAVSPDAKILKKEYRDVNGIKVIFMNMTGTIQGIKAHYLGYYYTDSSGSTQLLLYTTENLAPKYAPEMFDFLNGFGTR